MPWLFNNFTDSAQISAYWILGNCYCTCWSPGDSSGHSIYGHRPSHAWGGGVDANWETSRSYYAKTLAMLFIYSRWQLKIAFFRQCFCMFLYDSMIHVFVFSWLRCIYHCYDHACVLFHSFRPYVSTHFVRWKASFLSMKIWLQEEELMEDEVPAAVVCAHQHSDSYRYIHEVQSGVTSVTQWE